jgi:hypothetical protein
MEDLADLNEEAEKREGEEGRGFEGSNVSIKLTEEEGEGENQNKEKIEKEENKK